MMQFLRYLMDNGGPMFYVILFFLLVELFLMSTDGDALDVLHGEAIQLFKGSGQFEIEAWLQWFA